MDGDGDGLSVGAVVVTYRRVDVVQRTLRAILAQSRPPDAIVVVDNDADRELRADLRRDFPALSYLPMTDNVGYGGGLAAGMDRLRTSCDPDWYWLHDDDSPPAPPALADALAVGAQANSAPGIVAGEGGHIRWGRIRHDLRDVPPGRARRADFTLVDGSLVSRAAVECAGYPRGDLFSMMEDFEYSTRVARAGFTLLVRARDDSTRLHLGSSAPWRGYYQARNHLRIALDRRSPRLLWGWLARELAIGSHLLRGLRWESLRLRLRGYADALRGTMGRTVEPN